MAEEGEEIGRGETVTDEVVEGYCWDGEGGEKAVDGEEGRHCSGGRSGWGGADGEG